MPKIPGKELKPFWQTSDSRTVRLYHGHVLEVLRQLPSGSVHMVVTSPPYWGLRDYGTGEWSGGDAECDHIKDATTQTHVSSTLGPKKDGLGPNYSAHLSKHRQFDSECGKCGAVRVDRQIGSEKSPDEFVANMVAVLREVRRVLRDDGTLWLNLGDTYAASGYGETRTKETVSDAVKGTDNAYQRLLRNYTADGAGSVSMKVESGMKSGNLVGIPWRVALALQADGWILRQDIVWAKPSPMPESVKNRCTKAHEYIFLLTKKMGYFYDAEAIKEENSPTQGGWQTRQNSGNKSAKGNSETSQVENGDESTGGVGDSVSGRNKRSVWNVSSQGYPGAHFATYPPKLIEPCILAGTSEYGCCVSCGAPWKRVVEEKQLTRERPNDYVKRTGEEGTGNSCANSVAGVESKTVGWEPTCECFLDKDKNCRECGTSWETNQQPVGKDWNSAKRAAGNILKMGQSSQDREDDADRQRPKPIVNREHPCECFTHKVQPCVVLDPFIGSGTTCCVSIAHGRHSIGIDLSEKYLRENAVPRIEGELLSRPALKYLTGRQAKAVEIGRKLT